MVWSSILAFLIFRISRLLAMAKPNSYFFLEIMFMGCSSNFRDVVITPSLSQSKHIFVLYFDVSTTNFPKFTSPSSVKTQFRIFLEIMFMGDGPIFTDVVTASSLSQSKYAFVLILVFLKLIFQFLRLPMTSKHNFQYFSEYYL